MPAIDISIIIIVYNGGKHIKKCLESILKYNNRVGLEIIVIENGSTDNTLSVLNEFSCIRVIKNKVNRGVAARNQGIPFARGRYLLFLDADVEFTDNDVLYDVVNYMDANSNTGILGVKLLYGDGSLQFSCRKFPGIMTVLLVRFNFLKFIRNLKFYREHLMLDFNHETIQTVDYVFGAFQFFRRETIEAINGYDENYFYGPDDIDVCLSAIRKKWLTVYYPLVKIIHYEQRLTAANPFSKLFLKHIQGLIYYFNKYRYIVYPEKQL